MNFFKPIVHLFRKTIMDQPDEYFLHATTFCDKANFYADGHFPLSQELDPSGNMHVDLKIAEDIETPALNAITPVVHILPLGHLPFEEGQGGIKVNIMLVGNSRNANGEGELKGSKTVNPTDADEDSRPI